MTEAQTDTIGAGALRVRVALAEDSFIVREGSPRCWPAQGDIEVVALLQRPRRVLAAVESERARRRGDRHPDAADAHRRGHPPGRDAPRQPPGHRRRRPEQLRRPGYALALLESGSEGRSYLLKERVHDRAQLALGDPHGRTPAARSWTRRSSSRSWPRARAASGRRSAELTPREREVLAHIAEGKSNAAIAESLFLTKRAVEKNINSIFLKLNLAGARTSASASRRR